VTSLKALKEKKNGKEILYFFADVLVIDSD
jgi:hypothetical protein